MAAYAEPADLTAPTPNRRPGTRDLIAYAAPAVPLAALYFPVYVYVMPFYASDMGVSLAALGLLALGARLLDGITDPLMGWIADRGGSDWTRRRLWMALSAPMVVVSVWQLMVPPPDAGLQHVTIWLIALTLSWTVALTPYYAWGAEIDQDYAGRARVTGWREGAALVGTVLAAILYNAAGGGAAGLQAVAAMVAITLPAAALAAVVRAPRPVDFSRSRITLAAAARALRANAPFRRLLGAYFINGAANALPAGLFLFFIEDYLRAPQAGWLLLLYFLCAVGAMPIWAWAARRRPKHRVWGAAMIYTCAIFACVPLLGPGDVTGYAIICALTGAALGADLSLPPAMQADVVDVHAAETGDQSTGLFFALWSVATKAALAVSGGLALIVLDFAGFAAASDNSGAALLALMALYAAVPIALKLWAVWLMWNFPIDRDAQAALRARIEARD
jgi:GPH family glycoside/pentoside/hexuronide:cation symporter